MSRGHSDLDQKGKKTVGSEAGGNVTKAHTVYNGRRVGKEARAIRAPHDDDAQNELSYDITRLHLHRDLDRLRIAALHFF